MIIKVQCQYCHQDFEDEGMERTTFCPHCGKETLIFEHTKPQSAELLFQQRKSVAGFGHGEARYDSIIFAGYLSAIVIPLVGFFIGIYLMAKGEHGHGVAAMALSVIASLVWITLITSL